MIADQTLRAGEGSFQVHIFPFRMTPANLQHTLILHILAFEEYVARVHAV